MDIIQANEKKAVLISCFNWYDARLKPIRELLESEYYVYVYLSNFDHFSKSHIKVPRDDYNYIYTLPYKRNISIKRIISHLCFSRKVYRILKRIKPDLVYALIPPNSVANACTRYKKNNTTELIIDIIDLWPESFPIAHIENSLMGLLWRRLRSRGLIAADYIFTECEYFQKFFQRELANKEIHTLYLFKNLSKAEVLLVNQTLARWNSSFARRRTNNEISIAYLGSINNIIDVENICLIVNSLFKMGKIIEVHLVGGGENLDLFLNRLNVAGATVKYHGIIYEESMKIQILGLCDLAFNLMKESVQVGLTIKSIDYFSMGIPIINNIKGDTWKLVEENCIGFNYSGNIPEIINNIENSNLVKMKRNVLNCYNNNFTIEAFRIRIKKILIDKIASKS